MKSIDDIYLYSLQFWGMPYIWGGDGEVGYDCSGFLQEILRAGGADPKGDQTAHALFEHFQRYGEPCEPQRGAVLFFGTPYRITHCAFAIDSHIMIHASGGGSKVRSLAQAREINAKVRITPITYRNDLRGVFMPRYQF